MKLTILLLLCLAACTFAQSPTPPPPACIAPEFRQFDFWLGNWKVTNPDTGKRSGTSEITRVAGSCAIREQWSGAGGTTGISINYYDPADREWHQEWVGADGSILHLHGRLVGDAMILTGETQSDKGSVSNRITWTPLDGGKVRQEWSTSPDDGKTWETSFLGIYEKQ